MIKLRGQRVRLFLDANILISAARKEGSKIIRLWDFSTVELVTSNYVLDECRRNLPAEDQIARFTDLMHTVRVVEFPKPPVLHDPPPLSEKDQPVLAGAVLARADFLVTGEKKHFGVWYGSQLSGIGIEPPSVILDLLQAGGMHPSI
jgi:predicted nucleic acid-binding protein